MILGKKVKFQGMSGSQLIKDVEARLQRLSYREEEPKQALLEIFIYFFIAHIWSICYAPGSVLSAGDK